MKHEPVTSSAIASVAYDDGALEVRFTSGQTHRFNDVPRAVFEGLLSAKSKGAYFHRHIKAGGYTSTKAGGAHE